MVPQLDTHKSNHVKLRATAAPPTIDASEEMRPLDFLTDYVYMNEIIGLDMTGQDSVTVILYTQLLA